MLQIRHHRGRLLLHLLHRALLRPHPHQVSLSFIVPAEVALLLLSAASLAWRRWCFLVPGMPIMLEMHHATCWLYQHTAVLLCSCVLIHVAGPPPPSPPPPSPPPPSPPPPSPPPSESWPCRTCWGGLWLLPAVGGCIRGHASYWPGMLIMLEMHATCWLQLTSCCSLYYILNMLQIRHHRVRLLLHLLHRAHLRPHPHQVSLSFIVPASFAMLLLSAASLA